MRLMMRQMMVDGADMDYVRMHQIDGFYSARISLKNHEGDHACSLIEEAGPRFHKWDAFIKAHDELASISGTRLG